MACALKQMVQHGGADVREKQDGGGKAVLEDGEKGCGI